MRFGGSISGRSGHERKEGERECGPMDGLLSHVRESGHGAPLFWVAREKGKDEVGAGG